MMKNGSSFAVYVVTCLPTGMRYVGVTKVGIERRWRGHVNGAMSGRQNTPLHRDIRAIGPENFQIRQIFSAFSQIAMLLAEELIIRQEGTLAPGGYNLSPGGTIFSYVKTADSVERSASKHRGVKRNPEASERAAIKLRGMKRSTETREKLRSYRTGKRHSENTRLKISKARSGKSVNAGEINGQAKLTVDQVRETRARLSQGESQRSIARSFGIHYNAIWKIANGVKWKSVI